MTMEEKARVERNAKRRARRATLRALYGTPLGRRGFGCLTAAYDMARSGWRLEVPTASERWPWTSDSSVVIQRVPGRDYDPCGMYWGSLRSSPLFWVAAILDDEVTSEVFIRAKSASELREYFEGIRFR